MARELTPNVANSKEPQPTDEIDIDIGGGEFSPPPLADHVVERAQAHWRALAGEIGDARQRNDALVC